MVDKRLQVPKIGRLWFCNSNSANAKEGIKRASPNEISVLFDEINALLDEIKDVKDDSFKQRLAIPMIKNR